MAGTPSYLVAGNELPSEYFHLSLEVPGDALLPPCLCRCSRRLARPLAAAWSRLEYLQGHRPPWERGPRGSAPQDLVLGCLCVGSRWGRGRATLAGSRLSPEHRASGTWFHIRTKQLRELLDLASTLSSAELWWQGWVETHAMPSAPLFSILPLLSPSHPPPPFPLPFIKLKLPYVSTTVGGVGGRLGRRGLDVYEPESAPVMHKWFLVQYCHTVWPYNGRRYDHRNRKSHFLPFRCCQLQYFGHLMWRTDSLEKTLMLGKIEGRRRRGRQRMRWVDDITDLMDMSLSKFWEMVKDGEA